jgi:tetratricopeptide (TPR) repeat protein
MFRKNYFNFLLAIALFLAGGVIVSAQTAPVTGQVILKKADGTTEPVVGALVEVFRTDQKGKFPSDKTNKKGNFAFAGLPLGASFVFSVSASNIKPGFYPSIKAGMEKLVFTVSEGDGRRLTEDEVRQALTAPPKTGTTQSSEPSATQNTSKSTAEQKKAQEEEAKRLAEYEAKKKQVENANAVIDKAVAEGNKAFNDKNYDLAIVKFDEGINADPDFAGSAPVLLNNKAIALKSRAVDTYNKSVKADAAAKASGMESVKKDFTDGIAATDKSLQILKNATSPDAATQKNYTDTKLSALTARKEIYGLMILTGIDKTKGKEAVAAFEEYIAAETDPQKKAGARVGLAEAYQLDNNFDQAVAEFEKVLAEDPENVNALVGAGLSLVNLGYINQETDKDKSKAQFQQAINYLQKFVDSSKLPKNQGNVAVKQYKDEAVLIIETLKKEQNVAPQKDTKKKP